jgi:hypothetical protein
MTQYTSSPVTRSAYAKQVQEAKAKRQATLQRVRRQRAAAYKRTVTSFTSRSTHLVKFKTAYQDKLIDRSAQDVCDNAAIPQGEGVNTMPAHQTQHGPSFIARMQQPLIAIPIEKDGEEEVRYFVDEEQADAAMEHGTHKQPIKLAGIWRDLDAEAMLAALDRIRHDSKPTPPIDTL